MSKIVFSSLRSATSETACLHFPDLNRSFVLQTNASSCCLGAVLWQDVDGVLCPVAYASHIMTLAKLNYTVTEKECLAILFALEEFGMYVDGATFMM